MNTRTYTIKEFKEHIKWEQINNNAPIIYDQIWNDPDKQTVRHYLDKVNWQWQILLRPEIRSRPGLINLEVLKEILSDSARYNKLKQSNKCCFGIED